MQNKIKTTLTVLAASALATLSASANSITVTEISATPDGAGSDWKYDLSFVNSTLNNGDFVTINDFGPGAVVTFPAPGWVFTQALLGINSLPATDSPVVFNATLTWAGGNGTVVSPDAATVVDQTLILFSPTPVPGIVVHSSYTTVDQATSGSVAGSDSRVIGDVIIPVAPRVPDGGATVALLGFALVGIEGLRRKLAK